MTAPRQPIAKAAAALLSLVLVFCCLFPPVSPAVTSATGLVLQDLFLAGADPALVGAALPASVPALGLRINPAGLTDIDRPWTSLTLHQWRSSGKSYNGSIIYPTVFYGTVSLDFAGVVVGNLDSPLPGAGAGSNPWAEEFMVGLGYGRSIFWEQLDVGVAARVVQRYVGDSLDRGIAGDLGLLYRDDWSKVNVGLALQNLGGPLSLGGNKQKLPHSYRLGLSRPLYRGIPLSVDLLSVKGRGAAFLLGTDADLNPDLNLRLGWMMGGSKLKPPGGGSWALGAGYRLNPGLRLDCASLPWGDLGRTYRLTVSFRFGRPVDRTRAMPLPFLMKRVDRGILSRQTNTTALNETLAILAGLERRWGDFRPKILAEEREKYQAEIRRIETLLQETERNLRKLETVLVYHQIGIRGVLEQNRIVLREQTALHEIGAIPVEEFQKIENRLQDRITENLTRIDQIDSLIGQVESVVVPPVPEPDGSDNQVSLLGKE
ncbi:hypothetical protein ACFLT7_05090 [candidate division KSB1 bacterium]